MTHAALTAHLHAHHLALPGPLTLALLTLAGLAVWAVSLLASPHGRCLSCRGTRTTGTGRRTRRCRACQGTGKRRRIGATAVHRLWWSITTDRQRTARLDHLTHRDPAP